ncbi:unnamed protein product [Psylliodes chrysocephalus]|uniref:Cathepsin propeptide inhibitor domain-containing protein n=1 Tax=Psylliodes chrysocephalus TaxID=3402493 RepID=A0A9P0GHD2_9CUCU|nr:unnamed protein product [Psylliodes chrysocephala]
MTYQLQQHHHWGGKHPLGLEGSKMNAIVLLIIAVTGVCSLETGKLWKQYKVNFQKKYSNEQEENKRFTIFQEKICEIQEHNDRYNKEEVSCYMGINQFSDLTHE